MNINISKETLQKIAASNKANPYVDITPYELGFSMPLVYYSGFFIQPGECIVYVAPAQTFKDKSQVVGYTGKSAGTSIRVAKGITLRTGSSAGKPVRQNVRDYNYGDLIITNRRVVFIGKDDSFEYSVEKISAIKILDRQSFVLQSGRASKNITLNPAIVVYAAGFISYVQKENAAGKDICQNYQTFLTSEQLAYCAAVRQKCSTIRVAKKKDKKEIIKKLSIAILVVMFIAIVSLIANKNEDNSTSNNNQTSDTITDYSAADLVFIEGHPRIFDSYTDAQAFYKDIGDHRIAVVDVAEKGRMERALKTLFDDEIVLYLTRDSIYNEYVGTIEINIFDSEFASDMTIEGAVDIILSYLPVDFFEYYISDASYVYENKDTKIYTYSCRLTDEGVEYRNSIARQYAYYYYIRIFEYSDGNYWKIETGYSAYGNRDKDWIDKYAKPWDAPIK